jgi:hypothetical protein
MNAFSRSWELTKVTFDVINKDRELIWFALLSFFFSTIFAVTMIVPTVLATLMNEGFSQESLQLFEYAIIFITYFGLAFIATFFNVCVVYTTKIRFEGGNATFGESLKFAFSRFWLIVQWSLLAATVGLLMRLLENFARRLGRPGQIIMGILIALIGMAWTIVTIFVVPVLVYKGLGPVDAVKKSIQVIKKTWGESLIKAIGLGLIQFLIMLGIIVAAGLLTYGLSMMFEMKGLLIGIGIGVLLLLLVGLVFSVASTIFNTALYVYANNGQIASGFDENLIKGSFKSKGM